MLYVKGQKLKELKETLRDIPKLSGLDVKYFEISDEETAKFSAPIESVFNDLNTTLYSTLLTKKQKDENIAKVKDACYRVISYLKQNYKVDLINNFFEEKKAKYDYMFSFLVDHEFKPRYREYCELLSDISSCYSDILRRDDIFDFPKIVELLTDYKQLNRDLAHNITFESTAKYLVHCTELILEELTRLVKDECKKQYKSPDVLPNNLRKIIYLLKTELNIDLDSDEE